MMMNDTGLRRVIQDQSTGSVHTYGTPRHPSVIDPILSKRVCFYKSGDPQFSGLRMVINNRTFKTFDALLDSLSKKVPLPFGVRNITTPRGIHAVSTLDDLEDGKSYICSDSRKVKPFNLAQARKKLPPWYHARPVSSRRRTVQKARFFPGRNLHKQELVVVHTPKKLLVFRNGDTTVKYTVMLHKRTTPTYESILEYISDLIHLHVLKLHTPDGRRVDGLPGLILCSGVVVAAGKEPFKPANYDAQKAQAPTTNNRMSLKRIKALKRKKKAVSYMSQSRKFSPSSERYIVNRIQNSMAGSSCDLHSNPTNSVDLERGHMLESVAETEADHCLGDGEEGQECLPTDDDIEKSFRVNQDGSMTVEMKVRLTLKEEETIHWTTTLTRSSVANQLNLSCLPEPEEGQEISSLKSNSVDLQSPAASVDTIDKKRTSDNNDEDPPSLGNGAFSESIDEEEEDIKVQTDLMSPRRAATPGHMQISKKQASMESVKSVSADGIQEDLVGSYSYTEQTKHGTMTEQYCMVKQSSIRPVPKPRRLGSLDANYINGRSVSTFKSAGMTEILQSGSSAEEITETVLHVYEQQMCQDSYLANLCPRGIPVSGIPFCRPATSGTGQLSTYDDLEPENWRPSTASESISIWRAESTSVTSGPVQETNGRQQREVNKDKRSPKKVINKRVRRLMSPGKRPKVTSPDVTEKRKKPKTFSSAGFLKKIYGTKSKTAQKTTKLKKEGAKQNGDGSVSAKSSQQSDETNTPSAGGENPCDPEKRRLDVAPKDVSQPRGILTRQTSMHQEKKSENKPCDVSECIPLPAINSSSSGTHEYVENWLEKSQPSPNAYSDEERRKIENVQKTENGRCDESGNENGSMSVSEEVMYLEGRSRTDACQTIKTDPLPGIVRTASVKQRIKSFESKSSGTTEKTTATQQNGHVATTIRENYLSLAQNSTEDRKPPSDPEIIPPVDNNLIETPGVEVENKSTPVKISLQKSSSPLTLSMDLPLPPPPENIEISITELGEADESSVVSSPLYRLSSVSSQISGNHAVSHSASSEKAVSPTDCTMEISTSESNQTDVPSTTGEATLPRTQSIKRAALVSNTSFDRKMSLRKASMDKYITTSSSEMNTAGDNVLPNGFCPTKTQQSQPEETERSKSFFDLRNGSLCCTSTSPTSLTSEERTSSASFSSSEALTPSEPPFKEATSIKPALLTEKDVSSPKPSVKKVKIITSPSPDRKSQSKKLSQEVPHYSPSLHSQPSDKTMSPNIGIRKHITLNQSPSLERKQAVKKSKLQKRASPYSQSLDLSSPPVGHKSSRKQLSRNLSSDNASESSTKSFRKKSSERKRRQKQQPMKLTDELEKTAKTLSNALMPVEAQKNKTGENQEESMTKRQTITNQPNMKPVLEEICYSIKSIRQMTQNNRPSCLGRSNSLPDFSSHVASTFGSSSKALLAFLSVMTLKEGVANLNAAELNANNVSCAEALKMIDSLKEIASIEDSHKLKLSLSNLQRSASKQLMQSWKGFQELSEKHKSRTPSPNNSDVLSEVSLDRDSSIDEYVIDEMMDSFNMPEELKEELASFTPVVKSDSEEREKVDITEDATTNRDAEETNVDVSSIIKKFTVNDKQQHASTTETVKRKPTDHATKEKVRQWQNGVAHFPPAESEESYTSREKGEIKESCGGAVNGDYQGEIGVKSNQEEANVNLSGSKSLEQDHGSSEVEEQEVEGHQLQDVMSIPENEITHDDESGLDDEEKDESGANEDLEQTVSSGKSLSGSDAGEEEEQEVECEERGSEKSPDPERHSEEEAESRPIPNELEAERTSCHINQNEGLSEEDALSNRASPSYSEQEQESQAGSVCLNVSADESVCNSDVDEAFSQEEHREVESKKLKVIIEEMEIMEEEEEWEDPPDHKRKPKRYNELNVLVEETEEEEEEEEEDMVSSDDEGRHTRISDETETNIDEDLREKQPFSSFKKSDSLTKHYSLTADEDSGNDHSSCEEHIEVELPEDKDIQIGSSIEEVSFYEKESQSEEEHIETQFAVRCDTTAGKLQNLSKEMKSQSVAERVILLEKKMDNTRERSPQRNANLESDVEEPPKPQSAHSPQSAPQSSLSFSYDSSGVITSEPESNRVRSIREMFLAKSGTDVQHGRYPSPKASGLPEFRAETSTSAGYQSQSSSELSSGEDDTARKSISKGFVRRTIERLYGKKDTSQDEKEHERPPSASKEKKKEHSSIFSPFHSARSKAMSEFPYFNSANALDTLSEATRCIAFNAQVGPGDSVPIDEGRWLIQENTLIRKSVSDPVGINKTFTESPEANTEEKIPLSHQSPKSKSEVEDSKKTISRKCTYFSLPHASDSDAGCQDELSPVSNSVTDTKDSSERNGMLPGVGVTDLKKLDNKVHPLVEPPPEGEVVVLQPGKGQGVMNRRLQDPDMLDFLYDFCGQNCPIL